MTNIQSKMNGSSEPQETGTNRARDDVRQSNDMRHETMMRKNFHKTTTTGAALARPACGISSVAIGVAIAMLGVVVVPAPAYAQKMSALERKLERLKQREPLVEEVQQQSMRFFRVDRNKVNNMRAGAAWKAAVPWLEISGGATGAGINETTLLDEYQPIENDLPWVKRSATGTAFEAKARMSWNLPNLLFNPEELDVASLMMAQKDVINSVTQLYYERRRLQVQLLVQAPRDVATRIQLEMRIEELTARLSGLTGGWFQEALDRGFEKKK